MIIHDVPQLSPEWFKLREKRMTASHAQAIAANGKGLNTYITKLMQEYYSSKEPDRFHNKDTERGNELEDSAAFLYQMETGYNVQKVGFVEYSEYVGCSPDLFVDVFAGESGMAQIKCPDDKVYFQYLLDGKIDTKYMWQMQMEMMICGKVFNDYVVYNPNFDKKIIIHRVGPSPDSFYKLGLGFKSGVKLIKEIEEKIKHLSE
jgi:putative phage-type endonuclease